MRHHEPVVTTQGGSRRLIMMKRALSGIRRIRQKGFSKTAKSTSKLVQQRFLNSLYRIFPQVVYHVNLPLSIVYIEISSKCNLACKMCYRSERNAFMSWDLYKQIIDELHGHHVSLGLHFAGEPLLHPQFKQFLTYVLERRSGFNNVGFNTNGTLFNPEIANLAVKYELDWVTFSLEGYAEVNDAVRIGSRYEIVSRNIDYILSIRKNGKPFITINATMQMNHDEHSWKRFVKEWTGKVDRVSLNPCIDENFHWLTFWSDVKLKQPSFCRGPLTGINILCNGDVVLCGCDLNAKTKSGNMKDKGIFEFWNSHVVKTFQYNLIAGKSTHYPCDYCDRWKRVVDETPKLVEGVKVSYDLFVRNYDRP
jgi:pyruvate-formate lyase-activating enzyme